MKFIDCTFRETSDFLAAQGSLILAEIGPFKWAFGNLAVMIVDFPLTRECVVTSMAHLALRWIPRRPKNVDQACPIVEKLWMCFCLAC